MDHDDELFLPEVVDEQIDQLSKDPQQATQSSDAFMLQTLDQLYKDDAHRLELIWKRLTEQKRLREHKKLPVDLATYRQQKLHHIRQPQTQFYPKITPKQRFHHLLAGLVAVLVVGSIFIVSSLAQLANHHSISTKNTNQTTISQTQETTAGDLYMSMEQGIQRVNALNGKVLWQYYIPHYSLAHQSYPLVANNIVYAESQDTLYAINAHAGTLRWSHMFSSQISPYPATKARPVLVGNIIYVSVVLTDIYAFNATDGTPVHTYHPELDTSIVAIAIENNILYSAGQFDMCAIDLTNEKQLWHKQIGEGLTLGTPHIVNGTLYLVSSNNLYWPYAQLESTSYINSFDSRTGERLWQSDKIHGTVTDVTITNGVIYDGATDGSFMAYDATNGSLIWKKIITSAGFCGSAPQIDGSTIYAEVMTPVISSSPIGIMALDIRNGNSKWLYPGNTIHDMVTAGKVLDAPVVSHGIIYVNEEKSGKTASEMYALNSNGAIIWHVTH